MCARTTHEAAGGGQYFYMLDVLFSRCVFIHLSLHESMAGNKDAQSRNEKEIYFMLSIINSLESVGMEGEGVLD